MVHHIRNQNPPPPPQYDLIMLEFLAVTTITIFVDCLATSLLGDSCVSQEYVTENQERKLLACCLSPNSTDCSTEGFPESLGVTQILDACQKEKFNNTDNSYTRAQRIDTLIKGRVFTAELDFKEKQCYTPNPNQTRCSPSVFGIASTIDWFNHRTNECHSSQKAVIQRQHRRTIQDYLEIRNWKRTQPRTR
jgi:hypothetical protein